MPKALSLHLRSRIASLIESGVSRRSVAARFNVSVSGAIRYGKLSDEQGSVAPRPTGRPPGSGKLAEHVDFLIEVVAGVPDITGPELAKALGEARGVSAHPSSVKRALLAEGFTYKKIAAGGRMWTRRRQGQAA